VGTVESIEPPIPTVV